MSNLDELNTKLADFPYVSGYTPSQLDLEKLKGVPELKDIHQKYVHVKRWVKHLASFSEKEKKAFAGAPAPVAAAAAAGDAADDDDEMDLFNDDDDEEAEKAKAERAKQLEAQKKGNTKPAVVAKSSIVLDVKVWDDETDLKEVEGQVRQIVKDGLLWGAAKTVPLAFGVSKLQIVCVVEDEKVSVDWLSEQIEELELVQSTDIAAFQKI